MGRQLYELIPEEGKHLADSHNTEGAFRGVYLDNETNTPCGAGEFMPVDIGDDEDSDSYTPDATLEGTAFDFVDILTVGIGIGIGVVGTKAYPYVKKWITTTAVPGIKEFWQKITKKTPEESIECTKAEIVPMMKPEEFSQSIDLAVNEFCTDTRSEEAQQHLLNIMYAAMYIANEIRQLSIAVLMDEDRLAWKDVLEKLATQNVTDGINHILEGKVLALDEAQTKALTKYLAGALIPNGVFVPIGIERIKEALLVYPNDPKECEIL